MALALRRTEILEAAWGLLEAEGGQALTMRRVAAAVGIQAPSLYKHFPDKAALEDALAAAAVAQLAALVGTWGAERGGDLARIARGYRRLAAEQPQLQRLLAGREARGAPELGAALAPLLGGIDRGRAAWAFAQGMVDLELAGRFPAGADLDAAWAAGIAAFEAAAG